jgi:uncharacterized protein (DUF305 family)
MDHGSGMNASTGASAGASSANEADVMFAQMMIPHHRQAVEMAALAGTRASDPDVKALAGKIEDAQQPEIDTMTGWLAAWGAPAPMPVTSAGEMPGMDHGRMPGILSEADMRKLAAANGAAFDKQFLTMMIAHHQGAVTMAQGEVAQGADSDAKALAQKIITDQQAEITTMQELLTRR